MTDSENKELFFLAIKYASKKDISEKDKLRLAELEKKHNEDCIQKSRLRKYIEEQKRHEEIYKQIAKDVKFVSKFVKKAQSRQTGEKTVFYDIDIDKLPRIEPWGEYFQLFNKYNQLRCRSLNLSNN